LKAGQQAEYAQGIGADPEVNQELGEPVQVVQEAVEKDPRNGGQHPVFLAGDFGRGNLFHRFLGIQ
jgi:hypothetical protein